ncbi:MAG: sporulation protein YqfD [Oscillospiraceae bacterium]|nr:sporulation protein YqfD [Oscillospiraceae bacterium]
MQRAINYGRGIVRFAILGSNPERFLNICAEHRVALWQLERVDTTEMCVSAHFASCRKLVKLGEQAGFSVKHVGQMGAPYVWRQLRQRLGMIIGLGIFIAAVFIMAQFVWDIEVIGYDELPREKILMHLQDIGIGIGTPTNRIRSRDVRDEMMLRIEELSWLGINIRGSRAIVEVRERVMGEPRLETSTPCHIVARKPGVIVSMRVYNGLNLREVGDTVNAGDILISGAAATEHGTLRIMHAMGEVYARTWHEIEGVVPLYSLGKEYTGRSRMRYTLQVGNWLTRLSAGRSVPFEHYDKQREERKLSVPPGVTLPLIMIREAYLEFEPFEYVMNKDIAEAALERHLMEQLAQRSRDAEILQVEIEFFLRDDALFGRLRAECLERIGVMQAFDPLELPPIEVPSELQ